MKNARILGLVLLVLTASLSFAARAPKSKVFGSAHDFKTKYNGASYTLCNFCHIAHKFGSAPTGPSYLLWNHTLSTVATYGTYTSDTMVNQPVDLGTTSNSLITSNLCLSCHDGTVAINSWYEGQSNASFQPIAQGTDFMPSDTTVRDLTRQHPINFVYPDATSAANIGMRVAANTSSIDGAGNVPLFNGTMQCDTCHDPHAGNVHFFFRTFPSTPEQTTTGSFCVYCHL